MTKQKSHYAGRNHQIYNLDIPKGIRHPQLNHEFFSLHVHEHLNNHLQSLKYLQNFGVKVLVFV